MSKHRVQLAEFPTIFDNFINITSTYIGVMNGGDKEPWSGRLQWSTKFSRWNDLNWGPTALRMSQNIAKSMVNMINQSGGGFQQGSCLYKLTTGVNGYPCTCARPQKQALAKAGMQAFCSSVMIVSCVVYWWSYWLAMKTILWHCVCMWWILANLVILWYYIIDIINIVMYHISFLLAFQHRHAEVCVCLCVLYMYVCVCMCACVYKWGSSSLMALVLVCYWEILGNAQYMLLLFHELYSHCSSLTLIIRVDIVMGSQC